MSKQNHFLNIEYPHSKTFDKQFNFIQFELKDVNQGLANAIRRVLESDIKTVGFRSRPFDKSTIKVHKNNTPLDNETLSLRLGLIPIYADPANFNTQDYVFIIDRENDTKNMLDVTSEHFEIKKLSTGKMLSRAEVKKFFPPCPITGEYILIDCLIPWENTLHAKPKFHIEATAVVSTAKENASFSQLTPVGCSNKVNPQNLETDFKKYVQDEIDRESKVRKIIKENDPNYEIEPYKPDLAALKKTFDLLHVEKSFYKDEEGEPYWFVFTFRSLGITPPLILVHQALTIVIDKVQNFSDNFIKEESDDVVITRGYNKMENALLIKIANEDHTLVYLLQSYFTKLYILDDPIIKYVSYLSLHPTDPNIYLVINPKDNNKSVEFVYNQVIKKGCGKIIDDCQKLINELVKTTAYKALKIPKTVVANK